VESDPRRTLAEKQTMVQPPYEMDRLRREAALAAIVQRCSAYGWILLAAHVRANHVHVVVDANLRPERIMNDLKSYASRCLNRLGLDKPDRKRWARHGSTRWLWSAQSVSAATQYVVDKQGDPRAVFEAM